MALETDTHKTTDALAVQSLGVTFPNPLILASGILGTEAALLHRVARAGAGAITTKSCGPLPREDLYQIGFPAMIFRSQRYRQRY